MHIKGWTKNSRYWEKAIWILISGDWGKKLLSQYGKIRTIKNSKYRHFLCSVNPNFAIFTPKSICDALCDLVPFAQLKKHDKHPWVLLAKLQAEVCRFTKSNTPPWDFFCFLLYKCYQTAQSVSSYKNRKHFKGLTIILVRKSIKTEISAGQG